MTESRDDLLMVPRRLRPGQYTEVWIVDVDRAAASCVHTTESVLLEAPNWAADGGGLLLNGDGLLWRLDLESEKLSVVPFENLPPINNDHVLDTPRGLIYMSANDGHIYVAPVAGGTAQPVTRDVSRCHFLHGVSPDGRTLAFVDLPRGQFSVPGRLALLALSGGETDHPPAGASHLDGPEYSPDGAWLYLNTEEFASRPGHAQLARVPPAGGDMERLVSSDTVDWFPHLSPDGEFACYISFPAGTVGHPPDLDVEVRVVRTADWSHVIQRYPLFGGQGTLNVNSWSPDSRRFAYVAYPLS